MTPVRAPGCSSCALSHSPDSHTDAFTVQEGSDSDSSDDDDEQQRHGDSTTTPAAAAAASATAPQSAEPTV